MHGTDRAKIPDDVEALKALCASLAAMLAERDAKIVERDAKITERDAKLAERDAKLAERDAKLAERDAKLARAAASYALLEAKFLAVLKRLYGPRADRLRSEVDLGQLLFEFAAALEARPAEDVSIPNDVAPADARRIDAKPRGGRRRIADLDHLPVTVVEHDLPEAERSCPCCGEARTRIGAEESWQVEYIPARFQRFRHVRHTYACRACDAAGLGGQVETAARPANATPVHKGMAGPGLLAHVVTAKFADYLPLHRLENIFARNGLEISRSTLCHWCRDVAEIARPLYRRMCDRVRASRIVATDDTVMPMQAEGKAKAARIWIYRGDDRNPYQVFDFTDSRSRDGPSRFLAGFRGTLLADAYGGYDGIVAGNGMVRAGCWAHARRKFIDAEKSEPRIAAEAVGLMDALFDLERRLKDAEPGSRGVARAESSRPIVLALRERLDRWKTDLLPKSPMAAAVGYALNQWDELTAFLRDPELSIHNNLAEQEMKRQALNRKNSLFVGNPRGGEIAAILSSLTSSCRRHGVDPQRYLTQLLVNLPGVPEAELDGWLPDAWKAREAERERVDGVG
jgi:transposase